MAVFLCFRQLKSSVRLTKFRTGREQQRLMSRVVLRGPVGLGWDPPPAKKEEREGSKPALCL